MTEDQLQVAAMRLIKRLGLTAIHVPNEGRRGAIGGARMKAKGVMAGVSDILVLDLPPMAIELKVAKGKVSESQEAFGEIMADLGWGFAVCRSLEAIEAALIEHYWADRLLTKDTP